MVHLFFSVLSLLTLASASSLPREFTEISRRAETGDTKCGATMCIAAVVNGSTVQYSLTSTGQQTLGWMGMGFGSQMAGSPMVIMWGNSDGSVTLSQRSARGEVMPTVAASPPRIASLSNTLSTTSGNAAFVFTIPANTDTQQSVIFGYGTTNPGSADESATLQQHLEYGVLQLDLTKALSTSSTPGNTTSSAPTGSGGDIPLTPRQRMILAHAIVSVVGFAVLLPIGVLLARYLRTFTPTWYTGHWIAQFGLAGPIIIAGFALGFKGAGSTSTISTDHKRIGVVIFALYLAQCLIGALIHFVKPKTATRRPLQNYFHALLGLAIIALSMYQIRTGFREEWPSFTGRGPAPNGINTLWIVWCVLLPVLYGAGLLFLRKQYRQESAARKGWGHRDDRSSD
ncbi:hypothetical protein C8R43DRAFT_1016841 [Mycena crocata]|nr:hypothetical protein C8R43DRAFT_1016841 [Mycena crocata]